MLIRISVRNLDADPTAFMQQLLEIDSLDVDTHDIPDEEATIKDFDLTVDTEEDKSRIEERVRIALKGFDEDFEVFNIAVYDVDPTNG